MKFVCHSFHKAWTQGLILDPQRIHIRAQASPLPTRQSSCETGLLLPGWLISQTLTQPFPPVYTCLVGLLMVTAHTTSPWFKVLIWRACRGIPGPMRASGGKGTGCIWPSAVTWKEYALFGGEEWKKTSQVTKANSFCYKMTTVRLFIHYESLHRNCYVEWLLSCQGKWLCARLGTWLIFLPEPPAPMVLATAKQVKMKMKMLMVEGIVWGKKRQCMYESSPASLTIDR